MLTFFFSFNKISDKSAVAELVSQNLTRKLSDLYKKVLGVLEENDTGYENGLKDRDLVSLKKSLEFLHTWSSLLKSLRNFIETYGQSDDDLKLISTFLHEKKLFDSRKEEVKKMLHKLKENFINVSFINPETERFEKQRDSFFENIKSDLGVLFGLKCLDTYQLGDDFETIQESCSSSIQAKVKDIFGPAQILIGKLMKENLQENDLMKINMYYSNLIAINKHLLPYIVKIIYL